MKRIIFIALAVMSVLLMGCAQAAGGNAPAADSSGIVYEDKNGETITVSENNSTISNIRNASLVIGAGVTKLSIGNVKDLTIKNATLEKLTVESSAELSFVNTQIEELESNGNLVIKEGTSSSGSRTARAARAANAEAQAEKASVVIDKLVMKGNVEAGVGLYKKIERAADKQDKYFEFAKDSTAKVEEYDDGSGNVATLGLSPVYDGFEGVKVDISNKPQLASGILAMSAFLKKGDNDNNIFWADNSNWSTNIHAKTIVDGDYFYWPFLEANKEYDLTITYGREKDGGGTVLLATKTIKVNPTSGRGDSVVPFGDNIGEMKLEENGDIVWTKEPQIVVNDSSTVSYELFSKQENGEIQWITMRTIVTNCDGGAFNGFNIYKDGFLPKPQLDANSVYIYNNKVFLIMNYNYESKDTIDGKDYLYSVHAMLTKEYSNEITFDASKYETFFDFELNKDDKKIVITKMPSEKTMALWKNAKGAQLCWKIYPDPDNSSSEDFAFLDAQLTNLTSEINIPENLDKMDWTKDKYLIQCHLNEDNYNPPTYGWLANVLDKTFSFTNN